MWLFLLTEVMFFGGMFGAYAVYRTWYPDAFEIASRTTNIPLGAMNTLVLIVSSLTMALGVQSAQLGKRKRLAWMIALTMFFGLVFLGVKAAEYSEKWHHQHVPGLNWNWTEGEGGREVQILFCLYFAMTGMHAMHMVVGVGIMTWLLITALKGRYSPAYYNPVEISGLYWHFVDIVWIFLFPLLYLI
ncbi:MAG: cytochrome c oxidase subunit 3 family protein [Acidobacteria bacterium]|nr:cytochrome c oxidase subunit 3 family protein [Acidobacteriota bacterium]